MHSEGPLTLIPPLRAGRGDLGRTRLGSLFGDPDMVPPKVPLSLRKRERVRVRVGLDCIAKAKALVSRAIVKATQALLTSRWSGRMCTVISPWHAATEHQKPPARPAVAGAVRSSNRQSPALQ